MNKIKIIEKYFPASKRDAGSHDFDYDTGRCKYCDRLFFYWDMKELQYRKIQDVCQIVTPDEVSMFRGN